MATALTLCCGLDQFKSIRTLNGTFTGKHNNAEKVLSAVAPVINTEDYNQIKTNLCKCCPHTFQYQELSYSTSTIMSRGNQLNFVTHSDVVTNTINKENKNSHCMLILK